MADDAGAGPSSQPDVQGQEVNKGYYTFIYDKPEKRNWKQAVRLFFYNRDTGAVLGRTCRSWGKILFFYLCFYCGLALLTYSCWLIFMLTLNDKNPRVLSADWSCIGKTPGLAFRPLLTEETDSQIIRYKLSDEKTINTVVNQLDKFLKPYKTEYSNSIDCNAQNKPDDNNVCKINPTDFGPCNSENKYGYQSNSPCVFLKINKIIGWEPELSGDAAGGSPEHATGSAGNSEGIRITCEGNRPGDREGLGSIKYYPNDSIPGYFFPYRNTPNYLSPLIAIQIEGLPKNRLVEIECRMWANNIKYKAGKDRTGSVIIPIQVDED